MTFAVQLAIAKFVCRPAASAAAVLLLVALTACAVPAARAARVDPVAVLRQ